MPALNWEWDKKRTEKKREKKRVMRQASVSFMCNSFDMSSWFVRLKGKIELITQKLGFLCWMVWDFLSDERKYHFVW